MSGRVLMSYSKNTKQKYQEETVLNGPQRMSFIWSTADVLMLKWMDSDTEPLSSPQANPLPPVPLSNKYEEVLRGSTQHHRTCSTFTFLPLQLLLPLKTKNFLQTLQHAAPAAPSAMWVFICTGSAYFYGWILWKMEVEVKPRDPAVQSPAGSSWKCLAVWRPADWLDSYLSTWSRFPDMPSPPMV